MEATEKQTFKESVLEVWAIVKACLTCFWFWLPPLFAVYIYVELFLLTINPLLLVIGPAITIAYALIWEDRRVRAQYGLKEVKVLKSSDPMFSAPRKVPNPPEVEKLVEEYKRLLKSRAEKRKKTEEET